MNTYKVSYIKIERKIPYCTIFGLGLYAERNDDLV